MFQFNKNLPVQAKFALNLNNCQGAVFRVRLSSDLLLLGFLNPSYTSEYHVNKQKKYFFTFVTRSIYLP